MEKKSPSPPYAHPLVRGREGEKEDERRRGRGEDLQNELMWSLITYQFVSKLIPNSPILSNDHELRSIVVNKGRFHRVLG